MIKSATEEINFPLNIIKEKLTLTLKSKENENNLDSCKNNNDINNNVVVAIAKAVKLFLKRFASDLTITENKLNERKLMIKDIKELIETNKDYGFLLSIIDNINK